MILNQILKNKELIKLFSSSYEIYNESSKNLKEKYKSYSFSDKLIYTWEQENFLDGFKNNFFSLLMGTVILKIGNNRKKNISYMEILSCLRQIITSTDNIIDKEEKGIIFFKNLDDLVVKNTMLNIATQEILSSIINELDVDPSINRRWIEKIYKIACAEAQRDLAQYKNYPTSEYIIENIHRGIGGELLELSLTIPKALEKNSEIENYSRGLFKIGMALQALDDLCDIEEDKKSNKANLAEAMLREEEMKYEKKEDFNKSYLNKAIKVAIDGFGILEKNGYPITSLDMKLLLRYLFKIRGLEELWNLVEQS